MNAVTSENWTSYVRLAKKQEAMYLKMHGLEHLLETTDEAQQGEPEEPKEPEK